MNSKLILKLLFGISILGLIFYQVGLTQLATIAFRIEFDQLLLVLSLSLFSLTLGAVNFAILVAPYKRLKFSVVLKNYLLSWAIGNLFPAKLGEASICLLLKNEGIKVGDTFVAFVVDRFISLFTVLFFATIGACYFYLELNYFAASILITSDNASRKLLLSDSLPTETRRWSGR